MRKICLTFAIALLFILPPQVRADFSSAYTNYQSQFDQYRLAHQSYQVAKASYLTYQTIIKENEAMEKMRQVLLNRNALIKSYLTIIQEKMSAEEGLDPKALGTFFQIAAAERTWLSQNDQKIQAATTIADLNNTSSNFADRYKQINKESKTAIGQILVSRVELKRSRLDTLVSQILTQFPRFEAAGEDTAFYQLGLDQAQAKMVLYEEKVSLAQKAFFPTSPSTEINFPDGLKRLGEGHGYLKDSLKFLEQIINAITS